MDGTEYMIKVLSRFRMVDFPELLKSWDVLSERQLQSVNFNRNTRKDAILQLAALCEDNGVTLKQIADLEIIYNCAYPQKRRWCTYQMFSSKGVEEAKLFDFEVFRKTFERNLKMLIRSSRANTFEMHVLVQELQALFIMGMALGGGWVFWQFGAEPIDKRWQFGLHSTFLELQCLLPDNIGINGTQVMINILEHGEAVWIRIAWGKRHSPPNQQRPSYVVHYPQTPYVFIANLAAQYRVHVSQALVVATEHNMLKELDLRGHCLNSLRDIALKRFNPTISAHCRKPLQQLNSSQDSAQNQRITLENLREKEEAKRLTAAAFGEGSLPKLEEVQYRLQTVFKDERNMGILSDRNKPFRCVAKFSSPNILESLRALPELGIAEVPISTMFSSIPEKGKNYFKITDKRTGHNTSAL